MKNNTLNIDIDADDDILCTLIMFLKQVLKSVFAIVIASDFNTANEIVLYCEQISAIVLHLMLLLLLLLLL